VLGYLLYKLRFEPAPVLLGLVLGGILEDNLQRGLILSRGNVWLFLNEPLTLVLLVTAVVIVGSALLPSISRNRRVLAEEN
jgi:putative tricarboxylic transport membrane protein